MKRWGIASLVVILACVPIWNSRTTAQHLLGDTDTVAILEAIQSRHDAFSWFSGDWPLGNHFYRPVSTLLFEADVWFTGASAAGLGSTNALLVIACVLALFWLARELTDSPIASAGVALVFAIWNLDAGESWVWIAWTAAWISLATMLLSQRDWKRGVCSALLFAFAAIEAAGIASLRYRMLDWVPGRTASSMTVFLLIGVAAYARLVRTGAERLPLPNAAATDVPATRNSALRSKPSRFRAIWLVISLAAFGMALCCYEQAVMGPLLFVGVALWMRTKRLRTGWGVPAATLTMVCGYLIVRRMVLPASVSGYQEQQFRFTVSAVYALFDFVLPAFNAIRFAIPMVASGWGVWLSVRPWSALLAVGGNASVLWKAPKAPPMLWFGYAASVVCFAPMAFLKPFDHYYFLPMAFRAIFLVGVLQMASLALVSAATRPALQAPQRHDPARGSLPRP